MLLSESIKNTLLPGTTLTTSSLDFITCPPIISGWGKITHCKALRCIYILAGVILNKTVVFLLHPSKSSVMLLLTTASSEIVEIPLARNRVWFSV